MFCRKCKCCNFSWLSGLFGLAAIAHTVRLIVGAQVQINGTLIPMKASLIVAIVTGVLSFYFCKKSSASCNCAGK